MQQICVSLSPFLIDRLDQIAKDEYTNRSYIIRMALLYYLRPQGRELDGADPDTIFKILQHRKMRAELKKWLRDNADEIDVYDG
jgi:metal-responsive CopG/Arc/MetJ family transcriptional regulator